MRKWFVFSLIMSVFCADFGAFAANARGTRGGVANTNTQNATAAAAPVSARAAVRGGVRKTAGTASNNATAPAGIGARAAKKQQQIGTPKAAPTNTGKPGIGARAAAKQKVINTGTKISAATENTTVSEECQDAYFGCMDSFCMLENTSGGRCQCSDRNAELDKVLADIVKLDEQSYALATEGVERLQMGQNADEIIARAKNAEDSVVNKDKIAEENKKKTRQLNLDAWNNNVLFDGDGDEDIFQNADVFRDELATKTGDALQATVSKMCIQQMPKQCASSTSMLQLVYAQKIKSDCNAYENSLKQQKSASTQKLQTAQKALRDAALEQYQNENKYDLGQCTVRFKQCMQDTGGCGDDFTGCVTLAAAENVKTSAQDGKKSSKAKAKQTTIKGAVSSITLAASTIDQITAKKPLCETVLSQCVKVKDRVWDTFLAEVAPTLKSAELIAEDNLRMNCISDVSECFQKACKEYMDPKNKEGSYDMCLSNPMLVVDLCKVKLEPCLNATGGRLGSDEDIRSSRLWNGIEARLAAMRVDACTAEVKACLTSEDACGPDYSNCVGLDTYAIGELCPADKLTACMKDNKFGEDAEQEIRNYVASVAQGIALQIDNNMLTTCQNAVKKAMITFCGDESTCPNVDFNTSVLKEKMRMQICNEKGVCHEDAYAFDKDDLVKGMVYPKITGKPNLSLIDVSSVLGSLQTTTNNNTNSTPVNEPFTFDSLTASELVAANKNIGEQIKVEESPDLASIRALLNNAYKTKLNQIESDPTVTYCMTGREVSGFNGNKFGKGKTDENKTRRFPSLTQNIKTAIAGQLMSVLWESYDKTIEEITDEQFKSAQ